MENLNKVDEKLNYKFYEYPYFLIRLTKIIFILSRSGFFSLLLKLNVFSNRTTFFIKLLIFVFDRLGLNCLICGSQIKMLIINKRSSFICEKCQGD